MDFKWLEDFLSLAETHSFSRAAERRGVTQSAFSRRIMALEGWLGTTLVNRDSQPVALTDDGIAFRETAEEAVRLIATRREAFRTRAAGAGGPEISILALHSLAVGFLPGWLARLQGLTGPVASRLRPDNFDQCVAALADGGYDFFLTFHHPGVRVPLGPEFPHVTVGQDSLVAVASPSRPADWASRGMPLMQYSHGSFLGALAAIAQAQPGAPRVYGLHRNEGSMAEAMKSMAVAGHGVVWLPWMLVAEDLAAGRLEVVAPALPMDIRLYRNTARARAVAGRIWAAAARLADPGHSETE